MSEGGIIIYLCEVVHLEDDVIAESCFTLRLFTTAVDFHNFAPRTVDITHFHNPLFVQV